MKTNVNLEKDFTAEHYKYLERFGELGPNVLARLAKNAGRNQLIVEHYPMIWSSPCRTLGT